MSLLHRPLPCLLLLALLGGTGVAALAAPPQGQGKPPKAGQQKDQPHGPAGRADNHRHNDDAMSDSIRRVEQATRGQVLSAERVQYEGRNLNRIKIVDARGRVRVYTDDPGHRPAGKPSKGQGSDRSPSPPTRDDDD
jgi:hypothetical protein